MGEGIKPSLAGAFAWPRKVHAAPDILSESNPGGAFLAGAEASAKFAPPTNHRSTEDSLQFHAQLRPAFAHRSRANYRNPTSVEKSAHRSKGRHHQFSGGVLLAGAEASAKFAPPTNRRSTEDSPRFHAQLRPTFAHRSRANYRNPTSVEKSSHRRKVEGKLDTRRRQHFFDIIEAFHSTFVE